MTFQKGENKKKLADNEIQENAVLSDAYNLTEKILCFVSENLPLYRFKDYQIHICEVVEKG